LEQALSYLVVGRVDQVLRELVGDHRTHRRVKFLAQVTEEARRRDDAQRLVALLLQRGRKVLGDAPRESTRFEVPVLRAGRCGDAGAAAPLRGPPWPPSRETRPPRRPASLTCRSPSFVCAAGSVSASTGSSVPGASVVVRMRAIASSATTTQPMP